jgi:hypothetical protein
MNAIYLMPTAILDHRHASIAPLGRTLEEEVPLRRVQRAHKLVSSRVKPNYDLNELQPASQTLAKRRGSCSQRMALLEAIARAAGVGTRVRGLLIDGKFWHARFSLAKALIPEQVLIAWPQFLISGGWIDFDEIFAPAMFIATNDPAGFKNDNESMFDAVEHTSVDFFGKTRCTGTNCDLSKYLVGDLGFFTSRDDLFAQRGTLMQTWRGAAFQAVYSGSFGQT